MNWRVSKEEAAARRSSEMESGNRRLLSVAEVKNTERMRGRMNRRNMKRRTFLFFTTLCICVVNAFAQDVITMKNGDDIQALVQEIGDVDIKYKKFDNPNGPNYTLKKAEILLIRYANGSKDVFLDNPAPVTETPASEPVCDDCDVITLKNGMNIQVLNTETGEDDVKFKKYDNPEGTDYTLKKHEVATIMYANGNKDDYSTIVHEPIPRAVAMSVRAVVLRQRWTEKAKQDFENRMVVCGFTKRVVAYDYLNNRDKKTYEAETWSTVGIWINFQKRLVALRLEKDNWDEIVVPIEIILKVDPLIDSYTKTTISPGFFVDHVNSNERITGMKIKIVTGSLNSGTQDYLLNFYEGPYFISSSSVQANAIARCMQKIMDELEFMMMN